MVRFTPPTVRKGEFDKNLIMLDLSNHQRCMIHTNDTIDCLEVKNLSLDGPHIKAILFIDDEEEGKDTNTVNINRK